MFFRGGGYNSRAAISGARTVCTSNVIDKFTNLCYSFEVNKSITGNFATTVKLCR